MATQKSHQQETTMSTRSRILCTLILTLLLVPALSALAVEVVFQPDGAAGKDTWVNSGSPTTANGTQNYLYFGGNLTGGEQRLYIEFDLTTLDPTSTADAAQLELYMFSQNGWMEYNYSVMQVTEAWSETALTWNTQPAFESVAVTAFSGSTWQGAIQSWHAITSLETLVQYWIANPDQNHGLMIKPTSDYYGYPMLWSSDYSTSSLRPRLVVTGGLVPNEETSWGGVKALFR